MIKEICRWSLKRQGATFIILLKNNLSSACFANFSGSKGAGFIDLN